MLFKNLRLYRLLEPFDVDALESQLEPARFQPAGAAEPSSAGWQPPLGRHAEALTHAAAGCVLMCLRKEDKVLPASAIQDHIEQEVERIEQAEGRTVARRERRRLRDEVIERLLPRALPRASLTYAYIDPTAGWLVVDAASAKRADELTSLLREAVGRLPIAPLSVRDSVSGVMTSWLSGETLPDGIVLGDECELRDAADEGSVVRCKGQDLNGEELQVHLAAGKRVTRVSLAWEERLGCVLGEDLVVRRLHFEDVVREEQGEFDPDEAARFDAELAMMALELRRFLAVLPDLFGGEERPDAAPLRQSA
jgi:recombination associated protein RdgC